MVKIYTLQRADSGNVIYIGVTKNRLCSRLSGHHKEPASKALKELRKKGIRFSISLIEECYKEEAVETEQYWIDQFRTWGFNLVNAPYKKPYRQSPIPIP